MWVVVASVRWFRAGCVDSGASGGAAYRETRRARYSRLSATGASGRFNYSHFGDIRRRALVRLERNNSRISTGTIKKGSYTKKSVSNW